MLIFDESAEPIILDSIYTPTITEYFYVLDLEMMDFTLTPLLVLEETVYPSITLKIKGFEFILPTNWNILVYAEDTHQLDVVEIGSLAGREFTAMIYGPNKSNVTPGKITVTNYTPEFKNVSPALNKSQMLCHPIGPEEWVSVSPSDTYNKYLKDKIVGDLIL